MTVVKSNEVAEKLRAAGMNASPYMRAPAGAEAFIVGNQNAQMIKVWAPEHVKPDIKVDKKRNQAVLNVHEDERTITNVVRSSATIFFPDNEDWTRTKVKQRLKDLRIKELRPVDSPVQVENVKSTRRKVAWTDSGLEKTVGEVWSGVNHRQQYISVREGYGTGTYDRGYTAHVWVPVEVTVVAGETDISLLVGIDETTHFVAMLPKKADSVTEAHEILKPRNLGKEFVRQGEWFFTPVKNAKLRSTLDRIYEEQKTVRWERVNVRLFNDTVRRTFSERNSSFTSRNRLLRMFTSDGDARLEESSSHASQMRVDHGGKVYVKGKISDTRTFHHKDVILDDWHTLRRNREITIPETNDAYSETNKRRRYWD